MKQTNNLGLCLVEPADKFSTDPLCENAVKLDLAVGTLSRANLLDNWYFADPINQRGQAKYGGTAWTYTIDRWETSTPYTAVAVGSGVTVTATTETDAPYLLQPVQNAAELLGKMVTLSVMLGDGTVKYASAVLPDANPAEMATYVTIENAGQMIYMSGCWFVRLSAEKGGTNTFLAAKLEIGSSQTLAHQNADGKWVLNDLPSDKGMELLKCCMSTADPTDTYANNKVTPTVINALARDGSNTMAGNLEIDVGAGSKTQVISYDKRVFLRNMIDASNFQEVKFGAEQFIYGGRINGVDYAYPILHTGNLIYHNVARVVTGSYEGTGTYGADNPCKLTFDFEPKFVYVRGRSGLYASTPTQGSVALSNAFFWSQGQTYGHVNAGTVYFQQSENSLSWYATEYASHQLNTIGTTYHYIAIG